MEWISRRYADCGLLGVDEFMIIERLGLAGLGLPAMSRQGLVFPKLLGRKWLVIWCCNDIIKHLYRQKLHRERMRASISFM
jgi:hypothetical protein